MQTHRAQYEADSIEQSAAALQQWQRVSQRCELAAKVSGAAKANAIPRMGSDETRSFRLNGHIRRRMPVAPERPRRSRSLRAHFACVFEQEVSRDTRCSLLGPGSLFANPRAQTNK